jgi:cytosine/adenosine deaminase-related metal-dependent hydrolase
MWEEWKMVYLVHKLQHLDPQRMNGTDVIQMAVYNNLKLAATFFEGNRLGIIGEGARADIIFVDYHNFTPISAGNLPWHILFGFQDSMVTNTIVAGKFLMRNRELLTLDEEKITYEARKLAENVWKRYSEFVK